MRGLRMGLVAGVGLAVLRAARARRAPQPAAAPAWPPLPTATAHQPPTATAVGTALEEQGTAGLVAEAAALEAAGVTEAAEVDPAAVEASRGGAGAAAPVVDGEVPTTWAPPPAGEAPDEASWAWDLLDDLASPSRDPGPADPLDDLPPPTGAPVPVDLLHDLPPPTGAPAEDLALPTAGIEAIILAEEVALEAERLEAERLELARLERERLAADEDDDGKREEREQEREEALARFAAQREEAQALLALQEEREASAVEAAPGSDEDRPTSATELPTGPADEEASVPGEDLWVQDVTDLEPAVQLVEDGSAEPELTPLVPDEAVADLDEEPAWGIAVEPEPAPGVVPSSVPADIDDARRPLMADDLDSSLAQPVAQEPLGDEYEYGDGDEDEDDEPVWASGPALAVAEEGEDVATVEPVPVAAVDEEADEEPAVPQGAVVAAVADAPPVDAPASPPRRPILTSDFDDALPAELLEEGDGEQATGAAAARRQRRSGQPRVPLKARRVPADGGEDAVAADDVPAEPAPGGTRATTAPQEPPRRAPAKAAKAAKTAKTAPGPAPAAAKGPSAGRAPAAKKVTKKVSASKKTAPSKKAATSEAPPPKRISSRRKKPDVRWVEPVGGTCPTGYPVKGSMSSGIFHVAGGLFYDRTRADRCYRDPAAAAADGLRQAKR